MLDTHDIVLDSYHRCEASEGFFTTFYKIFFTKSPEIPPKFAHTDMEKQKQIVMASLLWLLRLEQGDPIARSEVANIGGTHNRSGHNIAPWMYELWLDALCETVAQHDPQFSPELEKLWRREMRHGIELIISRY